MTTAVTTSPKRSTVRDRESLRARATPFLLVGFLGLLVAVVPTGGSREWLPLGIALGDLVLVATLIAAFTGLRQRRWVSTTVVALSLVGVTLVLFGDGHPAWDLLPL